MVFGPPSTGVVLAGRGWCLQGEIVGVNPPVRAACTDMAWVVRFAILTLMPNYRRVRHAGATFFFTVVTARRRPLLATAEAVATLRACVAEVRAHMPFVIEGWVVLPGHIHAIWTLPFDDDNYATRWGRIKAQFTRRCSLPHRSAPGCHAGLWQPRFWEHLIRDRGDFATRMAYLHYNPVRHAHVARVIDWPYSSFHRCVQRGIYPADWGASEPRAGTVAAFGE